MNIIFLGDIQKILGKMRIFRLGYFDKGKGISIKIWLIRVFLVQKRKLYNQHQIRHIRVRLNTKFNLKLTIFEIWTKFD